MWEARSSFCKSSLFLFCVSLSFLKTIELSFDVLSSSSMPFFFNSFFVWFLKLTSSKKRRKIKDTLYLNYNFAKSSTIWLFFFSSRLRFPQFFRFERSNFQKCLHRRSSTIKIAEGRLHKIPGVGRNICESDKGFLNFFTLFILRRRAKLIKKSKLWRQIW